MAAILEVKYFNAFWTKKVVTGPNIYDHYSQSTYGSCAYPGPVNNGDAYNPLDGAGLQFGTGWPTGDDSTARNILSSNFYIEESRLRGAFNANSVSLGVRAYLNEDDPSQQFRSNALIYSGLFNSLTNFNETNVFSVGESITKAVDPSFGSIQKLYTDENNLLILQENKSSYALIDKDAIYSAEGSGTPVTSETVVIGQIVPYLGEYGISQNPESFASFGFQKYYVDKDRGAVLRLSRDGITEISKYGMLDHFRDELALIDNSFALNEITFGSAISGTSFTVSNPPNSQFFETGMGITDGTNKLDAYVTGISKSGSTYTFSLSEPVTLPAGTKVLFSYNRGRIIGGYDVYSKHYLVSMQTVPAFISTDKSTYQTLSFDESINGWPSRYTFKPSQALSLENTFWTTNNDGGLYQQFSSVDPNTRGKFYDQPIEPSTIQFIMNAQPSLVKNFQTIAYEGSSGWKVASYYSDEEGPDYRSASWNNYDDQTQGVLSYLQGKYEVNNPANTGTAAISPPFAYAGFNRKENKYVANLVQKISDNNYPPRPGEIIYGAGTTGIKGFYSTVKLSTDTTSTALGEGTEVGGMKELFAAASKVVMSS